MPSVLEAISDKLAHDRPLHHDDALALWGCSDLVSLGMLADDARRRRHGDLTTFVRVATVSTVDAASATLPAGAGEIRVVGAAPDVLAARDALATLVSRASGTPVTAGALDEFERLADTPDALRALLAPLRSAGIFAVSSAAVDRLADPEASVRALAATGLALGRLVVEQPPTDPWSLLERVQRIHAAEPGLRTFAPVPRSSDPLQPTTGYADVKWVAIARLVLHSFSSIQVDWTLHGPKLAQVALLFGADDVDAVPAEDDLSAGRRRAPLEEIRRNIRAASLTPIERDARFTRRAE